MSSVKKEKTFQIEIPLPWIFEYQWNIPLALPEAFRKLDGGLVVFSDINHNYKTINVLLLKL